MEAATKAHAFVGRREELGRLRRAVEALAGEGPAAIAIAGEPGIGKTRLLDELVALAVDAGQFALSGRAAQLERDVPFAIFIAALDGYLASQNPRRFETLGENLTELARIFPSLGDSAPAGPGAGPSERYRAYYAVSALLERLAAARPLVLTLDDLQWADESSVELVAHLLRRPAQGPLLLSLAYRQGELPAQLAGAIDVALHHERIELMELAPLSEREAAAMNSDGTDAATLSWLYHESGGNPFYLEQLNRSAVPDARPSETAARSRVGSGVPAAVAAALAGEVAALGPDARGFLEGASVAGDPFQLDVAAAAAELPEYESRGALDELLARELVHPTEVPRRFRFRHPIVRRTVYAGTKPGWRLGAHARARDLLLAQGAGPAELAHHVEQAAAPGDMRAVSLLERAGQAAAPLAPGPAADWFKAALRLVPTDDSGRRLELLLPMATALAASGRLAESRAPLKEAIDLMPREAEEERIRLTAFLANVDHLLGHHAEATTLLRSALDELPDATTPGAVMVQIELANDRNYACDFDEARMWSQRALTSAHRGGHGPLRAAAAVCRAMSCLLPGYLPEAEQHRRMVAAVIDALDDDELADYAATAFWLVHLQLFRERYLDTVKLSRRVLEVSRSTGQAQFQVNMQLTGAWALICLGRAPEASAQIEEAIDAARLARNPQGLTWGLWIRCWIAGALGDFDAAFAAGEESIATGAELDENIVKTAGYAHFGYVCAEAGEYDRCVELLELAGAPDFSQFYVDRRPYWWEALSRAALEQGREDDAEAWVERGEAFVDGLDLPVATAAIRRARARLLLVRDEPESAGELAVEAARAEDSRGARISAARSRIIAGHALQAADRSEEAIEALERAYAELNACGAVRYRDEAARALRKLGRTIPRVAPRSHAAGGVPGLSDRELEIAQLAAKAKTNREIGGALFISEKTVEKHLSKVFAKLGISGRAAIGAKLAAAESDAADR